MQKESITLQENIWIKLWIWGVHNDWKFSWKIIFKINDYLPIYFMPLIPLLIYSFYSHYEFDRFHKVLGKWIFFVTQLWKTNEEEFFWGEFCCIFKYIFNNHDENLFILTRSALKEFFNQFDFFLIFEILFFENSY